MAIEISLLGECREEGLMLLARRVGSAYAKPAPTEGGSVIRSSVGRAGSSGFIRLESAEYLVALPGIVRPISLSAIDARLRPAYLHPNSRQGRSP